MHSVISAWGLSLSWFGFSWLMWVIVQKYAGKWEILARENQLQISLVKKTTS